MHYSQKRVFLRAKAISMIVIVICAIFTVYLMNPGLVSADENASGCCLLTKEGESCRYVSYDKCQEDAKFSPNIVCENTDYCGLGCCISPDGICSFGVSKGTCEAIKGYEWHEESACTSEQCAKGCCTIGDQCKYTTNDNCDYLSKQLLGLDKEFKASSPEDCIAICEAKEEGCCVSGDGCKYTTSDVCSAGGGKFYKNTYCAAVKGCESCKAKDHKECVGEDVYWFDSCGNKEAKAEDCFYEKGTLCGYDEKKEDYACKSINCDKTFAGKRNVHDSSLGGPRENGESWCLYESPVGEYRDRPGSQHYRAMCINGEEILEPCRDFRQEVCAQNPLGNQQGKREAKCIPNEIYESPVTQEVSTVPVGSLWDDSALKEKCEQATTECPVLYYHPSNLQKWMCAANCECKKQEWTDGQVEKCRAAGDCGQAYSLNDKFSKEGFYMDGPYGVEIGNPNVVTQYYGKHKYAQEVSRKKINDWKKFGVFGGLRDLKKEYKEYKEGHTPDSLVPSVVGGTSVAILGAMALTYLVLDALISAKIITAASIFAFIPVAGWIIAGVLAVTAAILTALSFTGEEKKTLTVTANCEPWVPPPGGEYCHLCDLPVSEGGLAFDVDGKILPGYECTKYKCKSLGTGCEFIEENVGTGRPTCFYAYENDVNSPVIKPDMKALAKLGYNVKRLPNGYEIIDDLDPYKMFTIAIYTEDSPKDGPTQCKLSEEIPSSTKEPYDAMTTYLPDTTYGKYHNVSILLMPDSEYKFFISCTDKAGNANKNLFVVKAHTKGGPDITPPIITAINPPSMSYAPAKNMSQIVRLALNEPAECRWDVQDTGYEFMKYGMLCKPFPEKGMAINYVPECLTLFNLTEGENTYYIRCKDGANNTNAESTEYRLFKSRPLLITQTSPSGTIYSKDVALQLMTADGAEGGKAVCFTPRFVFFETNSTIHSQPLTNLESGDYSFNVMCADIAENFATANINFTVAVDEEPPVISSLHYFDSQLTVELNEIADCQYSSEEFAYGEGKDMLPAQSTSHTAGRDGDVYYIICKDIFGNVMPVIKIYTPDAAEFS